MTDHRSELRSELVAAAARRVEAPGPLLSARRPKSQRRRVERLLLVAASIVALVGGLTVGLDADPASADVFELTTTETEVIVSVAGLVDDPASAAAELREAGLDVRMVGRPVPPSLVGAVTATSSEFGPLDAENDGTRIIAFRIPRSETGAISVEYGRPAVEDESYVATEPVPDCEDFAGQRPSEVRAAVSERYGPKIVWQVLGTAVQTDVPLADLPRDGRVLMVLPIDPSTVLVAVADGGATSHPEIDC